MKVELRDTDSQQVLDALVAGKADIGIASGQHTLNGVQSRPLFEDRFGLVGASDHQLMKQPTSPTIDEVLARPFIRNALCDLIQSPGFRGSEAQADVTVHNTHSLITMVRTGEWVTVLPRTVANFMPKATAFREISDLPDRRQVSLYVNERARFKHLTDDAVACILDAVQSADRH